MESNTEFSKNAKSTTRAQLSWSYWKTPVVFGACFCILQILMAFARFGGRRGWVPVNPFEIPAMLFGLAMFFLCGLLAGLLLQRLLRGCTGAWRYVLLAGAGLATPFAIMFSLGGGLLGPPGVLIGALIPYLVLVGVPVLIHQSWLHFRKPATR